MGRRVEDRLAGDLVGDAGEQRLELRAVLVPLGEELGDRRARAGRRPGPASTDRDAMPSIRPFTTSSGTPTRCASTSWARHFGVAGTTRSSADGVGLLARPRAPGRATPGRQRRETQTSGAPFARNEFAFDHAASTTAQTAPARITAVIETEWPTQPATSTPTGNRPAEAHDPQRHDPPPFFVDEVRLDECRERGDRDEVRVAEQRARPDTRTRRARSSANTARIAANARNAGRSSFAFETLGEHGADAHRAERGAEAEARVEHAVLPALRADVEALLGDHRHQADEREREEREREQRDQDVRDQRVAPGDAHAREEPGEPTLGDPGVRAPRILRPRAGRSPRTRR